MLLLVSFSAAQYQNMIRDIHVRTQLEDFTSTLNGVEPDTGYTILHHWSPFKLAWSLLRSMSIKSGSACVEMYVVLLLVLIPRRVYL